MQVQQPKTMDFKKDLLINQAISLAKDAEQSARQYATAEKPTQALVDNFVHHHQELLKKLRQLRTQIGELKTNLLAQAAETQPVLSDTEFNDLIQLNKMQLIENVMRNMHRPPKGHAQIQRWVMVKDTFAISSTSACALCHYFKLNPDDVLR